MDIKEFREQLCLEVEKAAHFRSSKADEYPEDRRNRRSAEALNKLAVSLRAISLEEPLLTRIWWQWYQPGTSDYQLNELSTSETWMISRYGFDQEVTGEPVEFLLGLYDALASARPPAKGASR